VCVCVCEQLAQTVKKPEVAHTGGYWAMFKERSHILNKQKSSDARLLSKTADELETCPRLRMKVPPTAFRTEILTVTLTLTSDLVVQSNESQDHGRPYTRKRSRSKVNRFES